MNERKNKRSRELKSFKREEEIEKRARERKKERKKEKINIMEEQNRKRN